MVPAHNEGELLAACLRSLALAAAQTTVPVHVVVVLDRCTDGTSEVLRRADPAAFAQLSWFPGLRTGVGSSRDAGARALIEGCGSRGLWLANTDADSTVPAGWLVRQMAYAADGAEAVLGTVDVADWSGHSAAVRRRHLLGYRAVPGHRHMHGANLAVAAAAYVEVGGFPATDSDEDVALINALEAAHRRVVWAADLPVVTSARSDGRAVNGFAGHLRQLTRLVENETATDVAR
ncbi:glycosyltransferase [Jatrophihabitans sp. DSM 45814]